MINDYRQQQDRHPSKNLNDKRINRRKEYPIMRLNKLSKLRLNSIKFKLIFISVFLGLLAIALPAQADPLQDPDFALRVLWAPPATGFIVRGGAPPTSAEFFPVYQLGGFGCTYADNVIELTSHFAFTGDVTLEFLNLPAGVTSQTASSLSITGPTPSALESPDTDMDLQASSTAALGDFTITLRATSGSIVHTRDLPIKVVDELPECIGDDFGSNPPRPGQVRIDRAEYDADKDELRVEASLISPNSMVWVTVASTGDVIGSLEDKGAGEFEGELSWPVNPQDINVISSPLGGWETSPVQLK